MLAVGTVLAAGVVLTGCSSGGGDGADVADVEALRPKAAAVTEHLVAHEWAAVRADFDDTMRKALAEDGLANAWAQVVAQQGAYVSHGDPTQIPKASGLAVFDTPLTFERGTMKNRVAFHPDGTIAGLFLLSPDAP